MWRIFQGIPRAFRSQWCNHARNAPQAVNHEEEAELEHYLHQQSWLCTQTHGPAFEENEVRSDESAEQQKSEEGNHEGCGRRERWGAHGFNRWANHDCLTQVESFGWGAALLVSLRLTLAWQRENRAVYSERVRDKHWLTQQACAFPALAPEHLNARSSILAESSTQPTEQSCVTIVEDSLSSHDEEIEASVVEVRRPWVEERVHKVTAQENDPKGERATDPLKQAVSDWEALTALYTNMKLNSVATKLASKNKFKEAFGLWTEASTNGYAKASYNLALCYETGQGITVDTGKAVEYYRKAASEGYPKAMYNLALMYIEGSGVAKDELKARQLMERAAELGLKQAQTDLGVFYTQEGHRDMEKAALLFSKAAKQEDNAAQYYLGVCYEQGLGVISNPCKAADLFRQSAHAGYVPAYHSLAKMFEHGNAGLQEDKEEALRLYEKAAKEGHKTSQAAATKLKQLLRRKKISDAAEAKQSSVTYLSHVFDELGQFGSMGLKLNSSSSSTSSSSASSSSSSSSSMKTFNHLVEDLDFRENSVRDLQEIPAVLCT